MILGNFSFILVFYLLLSYSAVFHFSSSEIFDIYTINFFRLFELSDPVGDRVLSVFGYYIGDKPFPFLLEVLLFPTVAILPPLAIAFGTTSIEVLMSITGGFPGIWLQYMIPTSLAFAGKYIITLKLKLEYKNKDKSPLSHMVFLGFVYNSVDGDEYDPGNYE